MLYWPEPQRDETLYSLLARMARLNAMPSGLALCDQLTSTRSASIMSAAFNLVEVCEKAEGRLGSPGQILRQMTAFHVAEKLGDVDAERLSDIVSGANTFNLSAEEFGGFCRWRICPECMVSDVAESGVAWWHRAHQLPTSLVCSNHGIPLAKFDVKRYRTHEHFILPMDIPEAMFEVPSPIVFERRDDWQAIAQLGPDALQDVGNAPSQEVIQNSMFGELVQQRFVTRGGNLRRDECVSSFEKIFGAQSIPGMLKRSDADLEPMALINGVWPNRAGGQPLIKLLLVYWLFGSWRLYRERCGWESIFQPGKQQTGAVVRRESNKPTTSLNEHRKICDEFLASGGAQTRSGFWRAFPKSLRWLKRHDAAWLNGKLPVKVSGSGQGELF